MLNYYWENCFIVIYLVLCVSFYEISWVYTQLTEICNFEIICNHFQYFKLSSLCISILMSSHSNPSNCIQYYCTQVNVCHQCKYDKWPTHMPAVKHVSTVSAPQFEPETEDSKDVCCQQNGKNTHVLSTKWKEHTLDHKTSRKGQFCEIEIFTSSESWINKLSIDVY